MTDGTHAVDSPPEHRTHKRPYVGVLAVEGVVLLALWWFQTAFGR